jgi:hypothetical protein
MSCRLRNPTLVPPGDFDYQQPETGVHRNGRSLGKTIELVQEHRVSNGLPRQSREEVAEDVECQICARIPPEFCKGADCSLIRDAQITKNLLLSGVLAIAQWLAALAKGEEPFVDQAEANRRAAICSRCFMNQTKVDACSNCLSGEHLREAMGFTIADRKTDKDGSLGACRVCGCLNRVQVWFSTAILSRVTSAEMKSKHKRVPMCWKGDL